MIFFRYWLLKDNGEEVKTLDGEAAEVEQQLDEVMLAAAYRCPCCWGQMCRS